MKIDIAHVLVDSVTTAETVNQIDEFVKSRQAHYIVTVYSEFIVFANKDPEYLAVLNKADLSLADGVGILWAAKYLSLPLKDSSSKFQVPRFQALMQVISTGAALVFNPSSANSVLPEKVSGSRLIWDIAKLAVEKNYSLALVGGDESIAKQCAEKLIEKFPGLKINLAISGGKPFDGKTVNEISASNSDILCIAASPPKQEKWIAENLNNLNVKVAIGLGGTFDYIAGKRAYAPNWMVTLGLEWFWRLVTQPWRIGRMWNAIVVFIIIIFKYKLKTKYE